MNKARITTKEIRKLMKLMSWNELEIFIDCDCRILFKKSAKELKETGVIKE